MFVTCAFPSYLYHVDPRWCCRETLHVRPAKAGLVGTGPRYMLLLLFLYMYEQHVRGKATEHKGVCNVLFFLFYSIRSIFYSSRSQPYGLVFFCTSNCNRALLDECGLTQSHNCLSLTSPRVPLPSLCHVCMCICVYIYIRAATRGLCRGKCSGSP